MNTRKTITILVSFLVLTLVAVGLVQAADDGPLFRRNISRTPETMTGASQISILPLYVLAQNTQGVPVTIDYLVDDGSIAYSMTEAKPLFATYNDGIEDEVLNGVLGINAVNTGAGFGERDAFAALSLDDGATWKNYNLSNSADNSSFVLKNGHEYPGDVFKVMHVVEGNRVVVAWISRFCSSGTPLYSWEPADQLLLGSTYTLGQIVTVNGVDYNTYASDLFGVGGSQKSVDYTLQGFPEVGEVPYGCVWAARGTLEEVDANGALSPGSGIYDIKWRAAERLTSGRRDANRIEITSALGAGFIISWQEDPEGLRPGKGLGPGEGWSGAIANSKTDIWYTYIAWDHFDDVCTDDPDSGLCTAAPLVDYADTVKPKVAIPFAIPMRLTDNNLCKADVDPTNAGYQPYCYADFDGSGVADLCETSISWTNPGGTTLNVCQAEDGRVLTGRTASTRVRWALKPYTTNVDADGDGANDISAWVVMAEEKMKALGSEIDPITLEPIDIGKDMFYHTFDMFNPELVQQGLMLNSPAIDPLTLVEFPIYVDEWGNNYHETEIARRFNLMVQSVGDAMASPSKTSAVLIYKEGIINQGGPADIFIRRVVLSDTFDSAVDNPFAYENVQCVSYDDAGVATPVDLLYADGSNPNYVRGLCPVQGMNMSGTRIVACDGVAGDCASSFPWEGGEDGSFPKVTEWIQAEDNFNDPSWANPYDVSKGHRGFIDGDFVMLMYATAPNWKANTTGNEAYNLYIRRSFDGGQTWTTLPADYTHFKPLNPAVTIVADGTESCEDYGWGGQYEAEVCTTYAAGAFEQARNVSRLTGTKITVLDPRYSPTGGMRKTDFTNLLCYDSGLGEWANCGYTAAPYPEEIRDPSGYFVTYETGDNTVVSVETGAVPMDMYYARASNFGDDYDEIEFTTSSGQLVKRWDWLENGAEIATEASVYGNPDGSKFYTVWNQELEIALDVFTDMDSQFRRIFYNYRGDALPSANILFVSDFALDQSRGDVLRLVGTGRDNDRKGNPDDINPMWFDDKGAIYCEIDDYDENGEPIYECEKEVEVKAGELELGVTKFHFRVKDNEGNWSVAATVDVFVAEQLYQVRLPMMVR